ncbi:MAG: hypothetical protein M1320_01555 [Patescibacteria group bacterium]|nr:hypothetical protein [Patescibacteria group bacterium]
MIQRVAYLELCPHCGLHAHIRFSDNSVSEEFLDQSSGKDLVQKVHRENKIDQSEFSIINEQIERSPLPVKDGVQQKLMRLINKLRQIESKIDNTDGDDSDIPRCKDFILN